MYINGFIGPCIKLVVVKFSHLVFPLNETSSQTNMSSHYYEVALFGEFFSRDLKAILNRITLHSESSRPMHTREIVFEPLDAQHQRDSGTDPVLLRAKKELTDPDSGWYIYALCILLYYKRFTFEQGTIHLSQTRVCPSAS